MGCPSTQAGADWALPSNGESAASADTDAAAVQVSNRPTNSGSIRKRKRGGTHAQILTTAQLPSRHRDDDGDKEATRSAAKQCLIFAVMPNACVDWWQRRVRSHGRGVGRRRSRCSSATAAAGAATELPGVMNSQNTSAPAMPWVGRGAQPPGGQAWQLRNWRSRRPRLENACSP